MRIIPVVDLKDGIVVRGVGGRRDEYRPITSVLTSDTSPVGVAKALIDELGLTELYLADLNAIGGAEPSWSIYDALLGLGLQLWLDAGLADTKRAAQLASFDRHGRRAAGVIVGLESLPSRTLLPSMLDAIGPERFVLSIDLKASRPLAADPQWRNTPPEQIAAEALSAGVRRIIVLDLAFVGVNRGPGAARLCSAIRRHDSSVQLVSGGGVRGVNDLESLAAAGCDAALVASALHDGRLTASGLRRFGSVH